MAGEPGVCMQWMTGEEMAAFFADGGHVRTGRYAEFRAEDYRGTAWSPEGMRAIWPHVPYGVGYPPERWKQAHSAEAGEFVFVDEMPPFRPWWAFWRLGG